MADENQVINKARRQIHLLAKRQAKLKKQNHSLEEDKKMLKEQNRSLVLQKQTISEQRDKYKRKYVTLEIEASSRLFDSDSLFAMSESTGGSESFFESFNTAPPLKKMRLNNGEVVKCSDELASLQSHLQSSIVENQVLRQELNTVKAMQQSQANVIHSHQLATLRKELSDNVETNKSLRAQLLTYDQKLDQTVRQLQETNALYQLVRDQLSNYQLINYLANDRIVANPAESIVNDTIMDDVINGCNDHSLT